MPIGALRLINPPGHRLRRPYPRYAGGPGLHRNPWHDPTSDLRIGASLRPARKLAQKRAKAKAAAAKRNPMIKRRKSKRKVARHPAKRKVARVTKRKSPKRVAAGKKAARTRKRNARKNPYVSWAKPKGTQWGRQIRFYVYPSAAGKSKARKTRLKNLQAVLKSTTSTPAEKKAAVAALVREFGAHRVAGTKRMPHSKGGRKLKLRTKKARKTVASWKKRKTKKKSTKRKDPKRVAAGKKAAATRKRKRTAAAPSAPSSRYGQVMENRRRRRRKRRTRAHASSRKVRRTRRVRRNPRITVAPRKRRRVYWRKRSGGKVRKAVLGVRKGRPRVWVKRNPGMAGLKGALISGAALFGGLLGMRVLANAIKLYVTGAPGDGGTKLLSKQAATDATGPTMVAKLAPVIPSAIAFAGSLFLGKVVKNAKVVEYAQAGATLALFDSIYNAFVKPQVATSTNATVKALFGGVNDVGYGFRGYGRMGEYLPQRRQVAGYGLDVHEAMALDEYVPDRGMGMQVEEALAESEVEGIQRGYAAGSLSRTIFSS